MKVTLEPPPFHSILYEVMGRPPVLVPVTVGTSIRIEVLVLRALFLIGAEGGLEGIATI